MKKKDAMYELLMARNVELLNEQDRHKKQIDILFQAVLSLRTIAIKDGDVESKKFCDNALERFQNYQGDNRQ
jgi:hypothetical protein